MFKTWEDSILISPGQILLLRRFRRYFFERLEALNIGRFTVFQYFARRILFVLQYFPSRDRSLARLIFTRLFPFDPMVSNIEESKTVFLYCAPTDLVVLPYSLAGIFLNVLEIDKIVSPSIARLNSEPN